MTFLFYLAFLLNYSIKYIISVLSSNGPVQQLGALACESTLPCVEHLADKLAKCAARDDTFYAVALENARNLLEPYITGNMDAVEDSLVCHFGADSDALTLLDLVSETINDTIVIDTIYLYKLLILLACCFLKLVHFLKFQNFLSS